MSLPAPASTRLQIDHAMLEAMQLPLIDLAKKSGGDLRKLLFAFFKFLNERTDFYCVPHEDDVKTIGFKEGDAERLLLASFRQFPLRKLQKKKATVAVQPTKKSPEQELDKKEVPTEEKKTPTPKSLKNVSPRLTEEGLQIPVGNGGATSRYRWTQTLEETTVVLGVPENTRGKDLEVHIKATTVSVIMKNSNVTLLDGELLERVQPDESTWSLEGGSLLLVLQKQKKTWWSTVILGDDSIDMTMVDSARKIDTYDEVTQANIRRILFDQQQEQQGFKKPNTIEQKKGKRPSIPPLPAGVEYIDKETLDSSVASSKM